MRLAAAIFTASLASSASHALAAPKTGPGCKLPNADTSLHGIVLGDGASTRRALGKQKYGAANDPDTDFPWYAFSSRDGKQVMRIRHHAGDTVDSYMELEVRRGPDAKAVQVNANPKAFISGKGIKLGMRRKSVVALFGPCFTSTHEGKNEILRYEIEEDFDKQTSPALKAANMPQYYAEYEFENGRLIRFTFGHDPI